MNRHDTLQQIQFLYDQVHQTAERQEHLEERMPMHVHPESLNYRKDLRRFEGEYNRLVRQALDQGLLSGADLQEAGLPMRFDD